MTKTPFDIIETLAPSPWLITCDHASNHVPEDTADGSLGLPEDQMNRHIAYDVGAAGVTRALAARLNAPAILSRFSRLVIDPNRGEDDPTLIMKVYDQTIIPANRAIDITERDRRLNAYYRPYHAAYADLAASDPIIVAIHSFTPRLNGRDPRPWHIGVLFAGDKRFSAPMIKRLEVEPDLCVGINQPYNGHLPGDAIDRHALQHGRVNVLIELRSDLIETATEQEHWAKRLALYLEDVRQTANL
jgi:predicted N-formylglutamate amidohydrolase